MYCPKCGRQVSGATAFCVNCGCKLGAPVTPGGSGRKPEKGRGKKIAVIAAIAGTVVAALALLIVLYAAKIICIHSWEDADCTNPRTCSRCEKTQGEALGHEYAPATCTEPQTCTRCKKTKGKPLEHDYTEATCLSPRTCSSCGATDGEPLAHDVSEATCTDSAVCILCDTVMEPALGHDFADATCTAPRTCTRCGETDGNPLDHRFEDATCTAPRTCSVCGATDGEALGHTWVDATAATPQYCSVCHEMVPSSLPANGTVFVGGSGSSSITIDCTNSSESYYVRLKDSSDNLVTAFFVRAGYSATVSVPGQNLYVYYCCGTEWYGTDYQFGDDTSYYMDDEVCDFSSYTFTYTMQATTNGNFSGTSIDSDDF